MSGTADGDSYDEYHRNALLLARSEHFAELKAVMTDSDYKKYLSAYMSATVEQLPSSYQNHIRKPSKPLNFTDFPLETRINTYSLLIGDVVYAESTAADTWERGIFYDDPEELMDMPQEAATFPKDWVYYQKPEGALKNLMLVSRDFRYEIIRYVLPEREFKFGDVAGFLSFLEHPVLFQPETFLNLRKINILVYREGACLLPIGEQILDLVLLEGEEPNGMTDREKTVLKKALSQLKLQEFKLTFRDSMSQIGLASIPQAVKYDGLIEDIAENITTTNFPLHFLEGAKQQITIEFEDDMGDMEQTWRLPLLED